MHKYPVLLILIIIFSATCSKKQEEATGSSQNNEKSPDNVVTTNNKNSDDEQAEAEIKALETQISNNTFDSSTRKLLAQLMDLNPKRAMLMYEKGLASEQAEAYKYLAPVFSLALIEKIPMSEVLEWLQTQKKIHKGVDWKLFSKKIAQIDATAGLTIAEKFDSTLRHNMIIACIASLSANDSAKVIQILDAYKNTSEKDLGYFCIANNLYAQKDYAAALAATKKMSAAPVGRKNLLGSIFQSLFVDNKVEAMALLHEQTHSDQLAVFTSDTFKSVFFNNLPAADGLKQLSEIPITSNTLSLYSDYLREYARRGNPEALQFVADLPVSAARSGLLDNVFQEFASKDTDRALQIASQLNDVDQVAANRSIIKSIGKVDYEKSLRVINSLPVAQQVDAMRELARSSAYASPQNAIKMIENSELSSTIGADFRNEMINHTVQTWAKQDREAAQVWVERLPATDRAKGVQGLVASWMKTDPIAASDWLSKQPAGSARDAGAREIIKQIKDTDPAMAKQWRDSMTPAAE
jgi:hypothetical protein